MNLSFLEGLHCIINNRIASDKVLGKKITGIIGEKPSVSAKSPSLWNPAFSALNLNAVFLPFDVEAGQLRPLVEFLRSSGAFLGGSVTVPYKIAVMEFLDEVDPTARRIGAVNTIVRTSEGKLVGYNTDGQGGVDALLRPLPGMATPFLNTLEGKRVLLLGAGGAARALAFYLADGLGSTGRLVLMNRTQSAAEQLGKELSRTYPNIGVEDYRELRKQVSAHDLIVNATTCGQAGLLRSKTDPNRIVCLEAFSPLSARQPEGVTPEEDSSLTLAKFTQSSLREILENQQESLENCLRADTKVAFYDIVHTPAESALLRHARLTGHRTLNGKGMNVAQAVDAFVNKVFREPFERDGKSRGEIYQRVMSVMYSVW